MRGDAKPVDGIHRANVILPHEALVCEQLFQNACLLICIALGAEDMYIGLWHSDHLQLLHPADSIVRIKAEYVHMLASLRACDRCGASVATGFNDYGGLFALLTQDMVYQLPLRFKENQLNKKGIQYVSASKNHHLLSNVFECEGRAQ